MLPALYILFIKTFDNCCKSIFYFFQLYGQNQNIHLRHMIRLPVSAQRAIIRPMTENHENQTLYILIRGKTTPILQLHK
jgi:hypothetical protein